MAKQTNRDKYVRRIPGNLDYSPINKGLVPLICIVDAYRHLRDNDSFCMGELHPCRGREIQDPRFFEHVAVANFLKTNERRFN